MLYYKFLSGKDNFGFGFGGTGKKSYSSQFDDYGEVVYYTNPAWFNPCLLCGYSGLERTTQSVATLTWIIVQSVSLRMVSCVCAYTFEVSDTVDISTV